MNLKTIMLFTLLCSFAIIAEDGWNTAYNPNLDKLYKQYKLEDSLFVIYCDKKLNNYLQLKANKKIWNKKYPCFSKTVAEFFKKDSIFEARLARQQQIYQDSITEARKINLELELEEQTFLASQNKQLSLCKK